MLLVYVLLALVSASGSDSSTPLRQFLRTEFDVCTRMDTLGIGVGSEKPMASPGEEFNLTDAIADTSRPFQRLVFYGRSDSLWFVYYEQGGIAHSWQLVLFTVAGGHATTLAAYWVVSPPASDMQQLKDGVRDARIVTLPEFRGAVQGQRVLVLEPTAGRDVYVRRRAD